MPPTSLQLWQGRRADSLYNYRKAVAMNWVALSVSQGNPKMFGQNLGGKKKWGFRDMLGSFVKKGGWVPISFNHVFFVCWFLFKKGLIHTKKFDLKKKRTRLLQCCKGTHVFWEMCWSYYFFSVFWLIPNIHLRPMSFAAGPKVSSNQNRGNLLYTSENHPVIGD